MSNDITALAQVFPAPAGINRRNAFMSSLRCGVPRASGDKPEVKLTGRVVRQCSPRQRG
ncbi:TPA: hypothetical protein I8F17_001554 [Salmonella enterica]|uniref:hypothetical protein n=1 Tax=Salmonella enterica TaxID=28901 RepID=UPI0003BD7DE1|nr:hypothetical protein [Salmonella enterica]EEC6565913.1 hypothetical protein [Salmonella enterica subsp. enterica serovar Kentucky]EEN1145594.1 hypothetical protein [Salmonella enterica subsp. enterica]ESG70190.1 hypothetical protein SEEK9263_11025 [Salmonella enterica subsp. enterica serovar Kentucky str. ATCC 9263]HAZ2973846.1 hypothetical protein [Salmonella enterica subsp. enterica serovar Infantis]